MSFIDFHPVTLTDRAEVQRRVHGTECRNCDLNFMNLMSWRFRYDTEVAFHGNWLLFRFKADGHLAYLAPVGKGDWSDVMGDLLNDAQQAGQPFLMLGVCENTLTFLNDAMPGYFYAEADRAYTDYIYKRQALATLAGKHLQSKRNHYNRFKRLYQDYEFAALSPSSFEECLFLDEQWNGTKDDSHASYTHEDERRSLSYVLGHWDELGGSGGVLRIDGKLVAFTYGAPINYDTFGVCFEKADTNYEGAYAAINCEFARTLPECYVYLNREEDLGIEGLRKAKLSYRPEFLLHKYTVMAKHPFARS